MVVERTDSEILVRFPLDSNLFESQNIIDLLRYREIVSSSRANDGEIDDITDFVNNEINEVILSRLAD